MLEFSFNWLNDPEIQKLIDSKPVTREEQQAWFECLPSKKDLLIWGIAYQDTPIGVFGIKNIADGQGEYWGYIGDKRYWGQGIGMWMIETALDLALEKNMNRIYLKVLRSNKRALNLYLKCGFKIVVGSQFDDELLILERYL